MYGRFRVLSGDISLMYGSPKGEKPEKCTPEVGFSHDGLPYISEKLHVKKQNLPYITQQGRLKWEYCAKCRALALKTDAPCLLCGNL